MKGFSAIAMLVLAGVVSGAEKVTLTWSPSPSAGVSHYRLYFGMNSGAYGFVTNSGLVCTQQVELPRRGRWFFAATACDTNGIESPFSNEVQCELRPEPPVMNGESWVRLTPLIQRSTNLLHWSGPICGEPTFFAATNASEFFRTASLAIEPVTKVNP